MFTHIMVGSNDITKSKAFYDATLGALGIGAGTQFGERAFYRHEGGAFGVGKPADGEPATRANGGTIGFVAKSNDAVDAFHAAGLSNGGTSDGEPGIRTGSGHPMYGAYLRDPDGNKIGTFCLQTD
jgi:catechol 2,3-dioxygenase-like lactoylglutathione lyase family enzyme